MKINSLIIIAACMSISVSACARKKDPEPPGLKERLTKIAADNHLPTLSVSIKTPNTNLQFVYQDKNKAIGPVVSYGLASTTKLLAAVLVLKLVEEGKLQLDDPVVKYISANDFPGIGWFSSITVRNLLNHTSGIADYTKTPGFMELVMSTGGPATFYDKITLIAEGVPSLVYGKHAYSNTNYILLEKIIEKVSGKEARQVFNEFYAAQGLSNIHFPAGNDTNQAFFAQAANAVSDVSAWQEAYGFDGGSFAQAADLDRFLDKLFLERSILKHTSLDALTTWTDVGEYSINYGFAKMSAYGLGLMKYEFNGRTWLGHAGSSLKYQCFAFVELATGARVVLQTNGSGKYYNNAFFISLMEEVTKNI